MRGSTTWNFRPYRPLNRYGETQLPFICRLAPFATGVEVQTLDNGQPDGARLLRYRLKGTLDNWQCASVEKDGTAVLRGLVPYCDYEIRACRADAPEKESALRFFRTGEYPGRIVNYLHPQDPLYAFSGRYLCNPCLVKLPSGDLITCMDLYEGGNAQNLELIFRSRDQGENWEYVTDLFPCTWGTLFLHQGVLYMLATSTENGDLLIGASRDEGVTWSKPVTIFPGGGLSRCAGWQRQPMPILVHQGRLLTSIEYGCWSDPKCFGIHTLSIDENADLLVADNWSISAGTHFDNAWENAPRGGAKALLEGNLYADRQGRIVNLLRLQMLSCDPNTGMACFLQVDPHAPDAAPRFHSIRPMPTGANTKTYVQYDQESDKYWGIGNLVTRPETPNMRNVPALVVSDDGYDFRVARILYDFSTLNADEVGMQYPCFIIDGEDLLWLSRTAFNQAHSFHDSNCQTFHRIHQFRDMDPASGNKKE